MPDPRSEQARYMQDWTPNLASSDKPLRAIDMVSQMEAKRLWRSPGGKTPEATLYAAIIREISAKGNEARFAKHDRGLFVAGKLH